MPQIPEETLAKMPPAQRAQIEARMKAAGGAGGPRSTTVRSCITKETLASGRHFGQDDQSCTYKVVSSSAMKQEIHSECTRGQMKMAGDLTIERIDSEHVKGSMAMKAAEGGPPINVKVSFDNRFVSADCGDVKPAAAK
jgi:hypothetical protein